MLVALNILTHFCSWVRNPVRGNSLSLSLHLLAAPGITLGSFITFCLWKSGMLGMTYSVLVDRGKNAVFLCWSQNGRCSHLGSEPADKSFCIPTLCKSTFAIRIHESLKKKKREESEKEKKGEKEWDHLIAGELNSQMTFQFTVL